MLVKEATESQNQMVGNFQMPLSCGYTCATFGMKRNKHWPWGQVDDVINDLGDDGGRKGVNTWACYQIHRTVGCACAENAGNAFCHSPHRIYAGGRLLFTRRVSLTLTGLVSAWRRGEAPSAILAKPLSDCVTVFCLRQCKSRHLNVC